MPMSVSKMTLCCLSACLSFAVMADELHEPMSKIGGAFGAVRKASGAGDFKVVSENAATLAAEFGPTVDVWKKRNFADAVELTNQAIEGAKELKTAADASNEAGVRTAMSKVGATCKGCHSTHREDLGDHKYKIK